MYTAMCLSDRGPTKGGFKTEKEAINYIESFLCSICAKDLKNGGIYDEDTNSLVSLIEDAMDTSCGAEWCIITDEEYEEICNESNKSEFSEAQVYLHQQYQKYKIEK